MTSWVRDEGDDNDADDDDDGGMTAVAAAAAANELFSRERDEAVLGTCGSCSRGAPLPPLLLLRLVLALVRPSVGQTEKIREKDAGRERTGRPTHERRGARLVRLKHIIYTCIMTALSCQTKVKWFSMNAGTTRAKPNNTFVWVQNANGNHEFVHISYTYGCYFSYFVRTKYMIRQLLV